jgi:hypothetical protein
MDFIERLLHISPDNGNGTLEFLLVTVAIVIIASLLVAALRNQYPKNIIDFLEQWGKRESSDRFDN